jgi:hypothetical protein
MFVLIMLGSTMSVVVILTITAHCFMQLKWKVDRATKRYILIIAKLVVLFVLPLKLRRYSHAGDPVLAQMTLSDSGKEWLPDHPTLTMVVVLVTFACTVRHNTRLDIATATRTETFCMAQNTKILDPSIKMPTKMQHARFVSIATLLKFTYSGDDEIVQMDIEQSIKV